MSENKMYQTYLRDCDCTGNSGIIVRGGIAYCRWCRMPYAKGGKIVYEDEHFPAPSHSIGNEEWEIECIQHGNRNYWRQNNGRYKTQPFENGTSKEWLLRDGGIIFQVTRKSDGVVFTAKQRVVRNDFEDTIEGFEIDGYRMKVKFVAGDVCGFFDLKDIQPLAQRTKLFTTVDGVDVFEGDDVWLFYKLSDSNWKPSVTKARKELLPIQSYQKFYSTEAAIKEYITLNKPCLSVNDVKLISKLYGSDEDIRTIQTSLKELNQLAKKKLNIEG